MGLGWGIVEGTMDKTKQNQGEVVGKDIYGFWEGGGGTRHLVSQVSSRRQKRAAK